MIVCENHSLFCGLFLQLKHLRGGARSCRNQSLLDNLLFVVTKQQRPLLGGFQGYIELSNRVLTQLKQGAHHSLFVATKDQKPELNGCFGRPFAAPPLVDCDDPPSSMFAVYSPFRCLLNGARMHYSLAVCTVQVSSWNYGCNIPIIRFMCMVSVL